jgi:hypothetical protein
MWQVQVSLSYYGPPAKYDTTKESALWCRACVEKVGLLSIPEKVESTVITPKLTVEDLIREIVREEIE